MPKTAKQNEAIRADRKAMILNAALHVFAEEGYHAASISRVSQFAGVSKGLMYNYFKSKAALLQELLHQIMHKEIKIMEFISADDFTDQSLKDLIDKTFDLLAEDPKHWKLYFTMSLQSPVQKAISNEYGHISNHFKEKFASYFEAKFGDDFESEMHYFNTCFGGMKIAFIMNPIHYPLRKMKLRLVNQFITS